MNDEQRALIQKMQKDLAPVFAEQAERLDAMCGLNPGALVRQPCAECGGFGGQWWHEQDGSENGEKCPACDGFGHTG